MDPNYRKPAFLVLTLVGLLTALAVYLVSQLNFDYDFESFFPQNDPETEFYMDFRKTFQSDNDYLLVGLKNEEGVFQEDFLIRSDSLIRDLKATKFITGVISVLDSIEMRRGGLLGEPYVFPPIKYDKPDFYSADSTKIYESGDYVGTLISEDAKSLNIWVNHDQFLSKERCDTLAESVYALLDKYEFDEEHTVGRAIGQRVYIEMMQKEMMIFMTLSFFLILIFLYIAFRQLWGVIIPVVIVLLAIIWNMAAIKLLGNDIDLMLTILPTIIFVVGMSDAVHITTKYIEELRWGKDKIVAIKNSLREVGLATLLTSVTTAVGFLSLLTSNIVPISRFGMNMAIGVILAFVLSYSILPVVYYLMPLPKIAVRKKSFNWEKFLRPLFLWVMRNRIAVLFTFIGLLGLSAYGITKIVSDNFLLEDIREDHFLRKEIGFFEENFSGARPIEIAVILDENIDQLNLELLEEMSSLDEHLKGEFGLGSVASVVQLIKKSHQMYKGGAAEYFQLPKSEKDLKKVVRFIKSSGLMEMYINFDEGLARVNGQTHDLGRRYYDKKIEGLYEFVNTELGNADFDVKVTGTARLMDMNNERLAETMIYGLILAFVVIAIIVGILYKSIPMILISLIPNVLPLVFIGAFMGATGILLKVSTSIIFTIAFGIAVDDTIHFLSKFRIELAKGRSRWYALKRTYLSTGKAIIVTTLILCGGFLTLLFSEFLGTFYTGLLIGLTLIFAVIGDLFLLPVLIVLFYRMKS